MTVSGPERWITAISGGDPVTRTVAVGASLLVGREGDVPVGVHTEDLGVSRRAAVITAVPGGWDVRVTNRHGAVVHPWGQPAAIARPHEIVHWPRVALRMRGKDDALLHWVLLEADDVPVRPEGAVQRRPGPTTAGPVRAVDPLSAAQLAAVQAVFTEHLSWPPVAAPQTTPLKAVARRLGISVTGVKDRLQHARRRNQQFGLRGPESTTDPEHLFGLVRLGLLPVPPCRAAACSAPSDPGLICGVSTADRSGDTR